jgi:hypothetical protein
MKIMRKLFRYTVLATSLLLTFAIFYGLCADDERHGKRQRYGGGSHKGVDEKHERNSEIHLHPVTNQTYKEACGACHLAYQPGLLPSGSWTKVLSNLKDHFGETVDIDAASKEVIAKYLVDNAAEHSQTKWSLKIVSSLKGETPSRITAIQYIRRKHRDIPPEVFARKSVGSFSNCSACHKTADQGVYEDDDTVIPK